MNGLDPNSPAASFQVNQMKAKAAAKANSRVTFDKFCKCIPIIATINALVDMHQKHVYLKKVENGVLSAKMSDVYHKRIMKDPTWEQCILLVPVLGQIAVAISAIVEACSSDKVEQEVQLDPDASEIELPQPAAEEAEQNYPKTKYENLRPSDKILLKEDFARANRLLEGLDPSEFTVGLMTKTAEAGYPEAQYILGKYYWERTGQIDLAKFWLNQADKNGNSEASNFIQENGV